MRYKYFIILFLLFNINLHSIEVFCKKEFHISIIPFIWDQSTSQEDLKEFKFLESGIPRMIYSNLKKEFFVDRIKIPLIKIQLNTGSIDCKSFTLVKINALEEAISFTLKPDQNIQEQLFNLAIQNQYDGILTGVLTKKDQNIIIKVIYLNSYDKNDYYQNQYEITMNNPYNEKNQMIFLKIANDFMTTILKKNNKKFNIKSSIKEYKLYVNDISYGTNIKEFLLPEGNFKINIYSENCKEELYTKDLVDNNIKFDCKNIEYRKVSIHSDPVNSSVFMDEKFVGNTPLELELPEKIYRLRITKDGYIDKFILIDLEHKKNTNFFAKLEKGDNANFYYKKQYAVSNWTYYDLSFGFALQSLVFAGGWAYSNIKKEKALDSIRSPIIQNYFYNPLELSLLQYSIIENARKQSLYWHRQSQIYGGLGFLSLVISGFFLYKGIEFDLDKTYEYGSVSVRFKFDL